jgi:hypothetical protein
MRKKIAAFGYGSISQVAESLAMAGFESSIAVVSPESHAQTVVPVNSGIWISKIRQVYEPAEHGWNSAERAQRIPSLGAFQHELRLESWQWT